MNGASLLTSSTDGVVSNALGRGLVHITRRPTVGPVGVAGRPATARQQPLSTTSPAEQSSAGWDRGGFWVRRCRHRHLRCRRERRGRRQQAENNRQAEGKELLVADDAELHCFSNNSSSSCEGDWRAEERAVQFLESSNTIESRCFTIVSSSTKRKTPKEEKARPECLAFHPTTIGRFGTCH
jgi:hypothetical protein